LIRTLFAVKLLRQQSSCNFINGVDLQLYCKYMVVTKPINTTF